MGTKFDIEKFDGRINFGLWQVQVKDVFIQSGLHKTLKERPTSGKGDKDSEKSESSKDLEKSRISDEEWEELDMKAASQIRLCLAKNVLANHMQPILMYEKETVIFSEVTSKLISEEKRLKNGDEKSLEDSALVVKGKWKQSSKKKIICWNCKQSGHVKNNCPNNGASSAENSKEYAANVVSLE
ncbi:hypothetical protein FXO38_10518 [Capsicum annuum]|nr:hypothetical protein FXO37_13760 [Capsicum annuum]KAF3663711.1 hypothetical protein FXO38_10518 [Capsicum annuum]